MKVGFKPLKGILLSAIMGFFIYCFSCSYRLIWFLSVRVIPRTFPFFKVVEILHQRNLVANIIVISDLATFTHIFDSY